MLSGLQMRAAQAIANSFGTGRVGGHYAKVALIPGDGGGHLTHGRSQTMLAGGTLSLLVNASCQPKAPSSPSRSGCPSIGWPPATPRSTTTWRFGPS
jgi:hypothetical protein